MGLSRRTFIKGTAAATLLADLAFIQEAAARTAHRASSEAAERRGFPSLADEYSLDPAVTYLNHASIGTVPRVVQEAHIGYIRLCESNPWLYMWSSPWEEPREVIRAKAAALLNCRASEMVITHNTTECFNLMANGLPLGPGDEVLFSSLNHTGASACWRNLAARRGFTVRSFDFPIADLSTITVDDVVARYEDALRPNTKVVALPEIDNTVGLRHPLKQIAQMAHDHGVQWVVVDGAQSASMIPVDLHASGVDAYATSAHKWIQSPKGLGLAYISEKMQADLDPMWVTWGQARWSDSGRRFEDYGTRALPAVMALGDALDFQMSIPMSERENHHISMWNEMQRIVRENDKLAWRSPRDWQLSAALYSVEVLGLSSADVSARMYEQNGIVVRAFSSAGINAIRISPNVMNTSQDLERIASAMTSGS